MGRVLAVLAAIVAVALPAAADANHLGIERRIADELFAWTNVEREAQGLGPLTRDPRLDDFAGRWSDRMSRTGAFVHRDELDGVIDLGYGSAGENIASVVGERRNAIELHVGWWERDGHRRNMLDPAFGAVGFGVTCAVRQGNLTVYAVANFGGEAPQGERGPVPALEPQAATGPGSKTSTCLRELGVVDEEVEATPSASPTTAPAPTATSTPGQALVLRTGEVEPMRERETPWILIGSVVLIGAALLFGRMRRASGG